MRTESPFPVSRRAVITGVQSMLIHILLMAEYYHHQTEIPTAWFEEDRIREDSYDCVSVPYNLGEVLASLVVLDFLDLVKAVFFHALLVVSPAPPCHVLRCPSRTPAEPLVCDRRASSCAGQGW